MKKKNIALDFTSLLDIIMILLFIVISTMGMNTLNAKRDLETEMAKKAAAETELSRKVEEVSKLEEDAEAMKAAYEEEALKAQRLEDENNMLKAVTFESNIDKTKLYESLMRKTQKLTLICTPKRIEGQKEAHEVEVAIYTAKGSEDQEALSKVLIEHNFGLTREERLRKNSEMREFLYASLAEIVKSNEAQLYLISIQYSYGDVNFSQTDLEIIEEAIKDIERRLNKSCYVEKLKQ